MAGHGRGIACAGAEKFFHDAVFERMECDDGEPPARGEHDFGAIEAAFQLVELFVDLYPNGLKRAGRRVCF